MENVLQTVWELLTLYGLKIVAAVVILIIGNWVVKFIRSLIKRILAKRKVDKTISEFTGTEADRVLEALQKEKLRFSFENRPVADPGIASYTFVVTFADGTDVSIKTPIPTSTSGPTLTP